MSGLMWLACGLFLTGVAGALLRRSLLLVILSYEICLLGAVLAFVDQAIIRQGDGGLARALIVLLIGVSYSLLGAAATLVIFRRRSTINLDELRELRG